MNQQDGVDSDQGRTNLPSRQEAMEDLDIQLAAFLNVPAAGGQGINRDLPVAGDLDDMPGPPPPAPMPQNAVPFFRQPLISDFDLVRYEPYRDNPMHDDISQIFVGDPSLAAPPPYQAPTHQTPTPFEIVALRMGEEVAQHLVDSNLRMRAELCKTNFIISKMKKDQKYLLDEIKQMYKLIDQAQNAGYGFMAMTMVVVLGCAVLLGIAVALVRSGKGDN